MFVDLLLVGIIIAIAAAGFFQGTIKLFCALSVFYASLILAGLYYNWVAIPLIRRDVDPVLAQMSSFSFVVLLAFALLLAAALYTFRYLRVPARLEIADRLLGSGVGIVFGFVISSITALVLRTLFVTHSLGGQGSLALLRGLQNSARSSSLLGLLVERIVPQLYAVLSPFLPDAARAFFSLGA
jgi:membrane protein required for colicin V production